MTWPPPPAPPSPAASDGSVAVRTAGLGRLALQRHLPLAGTRNVRDVGGYPAVGGRRTRWRTLLRSDELTRLPEHAAAELRAMGLRQVIDLRWPDELVQSPNVFESDPAIRYRHIPLLVDDPTPEVGLVGMYRRVLDERLPQLAEVAGALLEPAGLPAVIGCAAGKDRTGITIAVLLSLAGVPHEVVIEDYALSAGYFADENPTIPAGDWRHRPLAVDSPPEFMAAALDHLTTAHGGARALLRTGGLSERELDALVDRLTQPPEAA